MSMISVAGKVAVVGGASQGIGRAIAEVLAGQGAKIIAIARTESKLVDLCKNLQRINGLSHDFIAVDMADQTALKTALMQKLKQQGPIEILINNTGGPKPGPIVSAPSSEFVQAFSQHLLTSKLLVDCVLPGMLEKRYGRIINITSTSVKCPIANLGVSNTIRWAMTGWAKTLANELAKDGITVNNVLPGMTDTQRIWHRFEQVSMQKGISFEEAKAEVINTIPMQRLASPYEIANAVAFLASEAAAYITGIVLPVDGGLIPSV